MLLSTEVDSEQSVELGVSYSEDGVSVDATLLVSITDFAATVLDNGAAGTSAIGSWSVSGGADPYGPDSLFSTSLGSSYSFETSASDWVELALRWTYWDSRCTAVPVDIYDGAQLLDSLTVNQQQNAADWTVLGSYLFSSTARLVVRAQAGCSTSVDAARFAPGSPVDLVAISIEGPSELAEESSASYQVRAEYSDGSSRLVDASSWTQDSSYASIDSTGNLTSLAVQQDQSAALTASYSENGEEFLASFDVLILDFFRGHY